VIKFKALILKFYSRQFNPVNYSTGKRRLASLCEMSDQDSLEVLVPEAQGDLIVHAQDVRVILTPEETLVN
jgi:hypothetical protein